jgi:hypothetical protein
MIYECLTKRLHSPIVQAPIDTKSLSEKEQLMDEIVKAVAEKTGMAPDMVRPVVEAVINEIKNRLPEPLAGQVDGLLGNSSMLSQAEGLLGGLLGGNK